MGALDPEDRLATCFVVRGQVLWGEGRVGPWRDVAGGKDQNSALLDVEFSFFWIAPGFSSR